MDQIDDTTHVGEPMPDARDELRLAREMIPVAGGIAPANFAQLVDFARDMAKAKYSLPEHLKGNVGDCLAVLNIATRSGLDPYLVGNKTYVQNGRLCFESQLFHALVQASGLLKGDLLIDYEGAGPDRICIVTGYLKSDPYRARVHKSPPLKDLHPGYTFKREAEGGGSAKRSLTYTEGQKMKADAAGASLGGELFSRGSPLWERKPDVQMFYDTSRDWVRMYCPRATLGIYSPEEMAEYGPDNAKDVTPAGLGARLSGPNGDGHRDGHADSELDNIAPASIKGAAEIIPPEKPKKRRAAASTKVKAESVAEDKGDDPASEPTPITVPDVPVNAAEYRLFVQAWLASTDSAADAHERWAAESDLRDKCAVPIKERHALQDMIAAKFFSADESGA